MFALVARLLIEVEDELSRLPYDPATPLNDGRMYPPQEDNRVQVRSRPDVRGYRTRGDWLWALHRESGFLRKAR